MDYYALIQRFNSICFKYGLPNEAVSELLRVMKEVSKMSASDREGLDLLCSIISSSVRSDEGIMKFENKEDLFIFDEMMKKRHISVEYDFEFDSEKRRIYYIAKW